MLSAFLFLKSALYCAGLLALFFMEDSHLDYDPPSDVQDEREEESLELIAEKINLELWEKFPDCILHCIPSGSHQKLKINVEMVEYEHRSDELSSFVLDLMERYSIMISINFIEVGFERLVIRYRERIKGLRERIQALA